MGNKGKFTILLLIATLETSSLLSVQAYTVDSITKPSIPEFTVKVVAYPYDVPPKTTSTIDQYTGKETTTTQPGYHVENKSIEIAIKNQPFTPYTFTALTGYNHETGESYSYVRNVTVNFYYNIQVKGHFGYEYDWKSVGSGEFSYSEGPKSNAQLNSEYTVISIKADYPNGTKLDFRVQTLIGYYVAYGRNVVIFGYDFYGQESDWSKIQTLNLADGSVSISTSLNPTLSPAPSASTPSSTSSPTFTPAPTPTPTITGFFTENNATLLSAVIIVAGIAIGAGLLVYFKKRKH
jgi:hypothetical protein